MSKPKKKPTRRIPKTRNLETLTERGFYTWLKNLLRKGSLKWRPANEAFRRAESGTIKNPDTGRPNKAYRCAGCGGLFMKAKKKGQPGVVKDHIVPVIPEGKQILVCTDRFFDPDKHVCLGEVAVNRMYPEIHGWQILCHDCHKTKTEEENSKRKGHE